MFQNLFKEFKTTSFQWFKSHTIMAAIVFVLLMIGLSIINYRIYDFGNFCGIFFISVGLTLLDFLPVIGLFVPMAIWAVLAILVTEKATLGLAVIILCFIIMIIKQVLEPFIIGKSMGISPIEEVVSSIAGYLLLGTNAIGFILGPILYTVGKAAYLKFTNQPLIRENQKTVHTFRGNDKTHGGSNPSAGVSPTDVIDISEDVVDVE